MDDTITLNEPSVSKLIQALKLFPSNSFVRVGYYKGVKASLVSIEPIASDDDGVEYYTCIQLDGFDND